MNFDWVTPAMLPVLHTTWAKRALIHNWRMSEDTVYMNRINAIQNRSQRPERVLKIGNFRIGESR